MVYRYLLAFVLISGIGWGKNAQANLIGDTFTITQAYPTIGSPSSSMTGSDPGTISFPIGSFVFADNTVTFTLFSGGMFNRGSFAGFEMIDNTNSIVSATLDASSTDTYFASSNLSVLGGVAYMNFAGQSDIQGTTVIIDLMTNQVTVPEPASLAVLGAGLLGLIAVSRHKRV